MYNSQYENYYNSLSNRANGKRNFRYSGKYTNLRIKKLISVIKMQLIGTFILFVLVAVCKVYVTPQTKYAYSFGKTIVSENLDFKALMNKASRVNISGVINYMKNNNVNDFENTAVNFIDKVRAKISGGKTIKEEINENFETPVSFKNNKKLFAGNFNNSNKVIKNGGIKVSVPLNTAVVCSYDGTVKEIGKDEQYGKYIIIDHGNGIETKYGYLNSIEAAQGESVSKNEIIGRSGESEDLKHPSLYFELIYMSENLNPYEYLKN